MAREPTLLVQSADIGAAMQATSKVPINHNVVSFWKHSWHWTITPPWRQERVDNLGTLGFAHSSHNPRKDRLYKAVVSSFYLSLTQNGSEFFQIILRQYILYLKNVWISKLLQRQYIRQSSSHGESVGLKHRRVGFNSRIATGF